MTSSTLAPSLVITDLDGTLLDHDTYSWKAAQPALAWLRENAIPVIINTSKTAAEVATLQTQMQLQAPFIVENGSAIFFPKSLFTRAPDQSVERGNYWVKILGKEKFQIVDILQQLRQKTHYQFEGFSDWTPKQIVKATGLSHESAIEASKRAFSEPLIWRGTSESLILFKQHLSEAGLNTLQGGRFLHVLGKTDKGVAINWLKHFYETLNGIRYQTIVLGDGPNDVDMLETADFPVIVKSPAYDYPRITNTRQVIHTKRFGPQGWNEAFEQLKYSLTQ